MAVTSPRLTHQFIARVSFAAALCLPVASVLGCGMVATPQPPSLKLPQPVTDLTAQRIGNQVDLHWTMPKRATDKVLLLGKQRAEICRSAATGPCVHVGSLKLAPEAAGSFTDKLPADLASGPLRPLVYTVELQNASGRSAGPSNPAVTAAGESPPQITNLGAHAEPDGVVLSWTPTGANQTIRIHRMLVSNKAAKGPNAPKASAKPLLAANQAIPTEQTLEFTGPDQGRVLDHDAALDHIYTYTVQRVEKTAMEGQTVEVSSAPSVSMTINARDLFPPATPSGLQVVADPEGHSIDLSWQPDTESDLAGYRIYRRAAGSGAAPTRIGAVAAAPSFRDTTAQPGHSYQYSVTAVDRDGNESPRSAEVEGLLPNQ